MVYYLYLHWSIIIALRMGSLSSYCNLTSLDIRSNGNNIEMKSQRSFDLDFVFDIEAKRTCLFQNLKQTLLILHLTKSKGKRILFIPQTRKIEAERTLFIPQIG